MKKTVEFSAKTVEEAVEKAVAAFGVQSADDIAYEVIEEPKKGFLGIGAAPARIVATHTTTGAAAALEFIRDLVAGMGLEATVTMREGEEESKLIAVEGESAGVLIGHHGDTLDALQYLANLAANKRTESDKRDYCRVTVDVENYRLKREETLRALARRMAEKVLRYHKSVMLEPMNPYERRIIHSEVQKIAGVSTNSVGSENNRKVVLYLDSDDNDAPANNEREDEFGEF